MPTQIKKEIIQSPNLPILALDTETGEGHRPFLGTSTDTMLTSKLYDLRTSVGLKEFKKLCESSNIRKIFHSVTSDMYFLSTLGIEVNPPYECTLIASSLVNEYLSTRKLKVMARRILGEACEEEKLLSKVKAKLRKQAKKEGREFYYDQIPREVVEPYATKDTEYTVKLWFYFRQQLQQYLLLYNFEKKLVPLIVQMQIDGIQVDRKFVYEELKTIVPKIKELRRYLRKLVGNSEYNPDSPKQVAKALKSLGLEILEVSPKTGEFKTDAKTLNKYKEHAFVKAHLEYKFYKKQYSTYYWPLYNRYTSYEDPFAHFSFYQSGAKTGRFSAELIQTIPKTDEDKLVKKSRSVRKAFIPGKGYWLLSLDYAQVEMRVFVHYSKCYTMAEQIIAGYDSHLGTAYDIFGKEFIDSLDEKTRKFYRKMMKDINFGIIYGMGKRKMISQMLAYDVKMSPLECGEVLKKYYYKYPVKQFMAEVTRELYYTGKVKLEVDSPLMKFKREYNVPRELAYKGVNVIVQGMSAYIMKHGMIRTTEAIKKNHWDAKMILTVHDELVFRVSDREDRHEVITGLKDAMEDKITFDVPILAEAKWSEKSWGDVKVWEEAA